MEEVTNILKKLPQRTCIGCNTQKDKKDLIRIVKNKEGEISLDKTGKAQGRGAYLCDSEECLQKARKSNALSRSFKINVPQETYEALERQLNNDTE